MTNKPRVSVTMDSALLERIDDYRYANRISTQSKAVQQLVQMGFQSMEGEKSGSAEEVELDWQERELIRIARGLDPPRQELLLRIAAVVAEKDSPSIP